MECFIKDNCKTITDKKIAEELNLKYGTNFSTSAVKAKRQSLGLKIGYNKPLKYTDEVVQFILDNYKDKDNVELAKLVNDKFDLGINHDSLSNFKSKYLQKTGVNLRTGINRYQFKKGQKSWNKGKKWDEFMSKEAQKNSSKTTFKKGNIPANHREVFEERVDKCGYLEIKVKEPNKWTTKHRYIYEQKHGKVPKGHKVIFADGNNRNFDIDNLILVSNAEHLIMNSNNLRFNNKKLTETGHLIAKIIDKGNKLKNERL